MGDGVSYKESCTPNLCGIVFVATALNKLQSGNSFYFEPYFSLLNEDIFWYIPF